jgi:ubiquinone biosynthesis protein Coq4
MGRSKVCKILALMVMPRGRQIMEEQWLAGETEIDKLKKSPYI